MIGGGAIARLRALIGLDDSQFKAGTQRVSGHAGSLKKTIAGIGGAIGAAFSVGAIVSFGKAMMQTFAGISNAAANLKMPTAELAGLEKTAAGSGMRFEELADLLARLQGKQVDAARGNEQLERTLAGLNMTAADFISMPTAQVLVELAHRAQGSAAAVAYLGDLFGNRLGAKTVGLLKDLAENGMGAIDDSTADAIDKMAELDKKWNKFKNSLKYHGANFVLGFSKIGAPVEPPDYGPKKESDADKRKRLFVEELQAIKDIADAEKAAADEAKRKLDYEKERADVLRDIERGLSDEDRIGQQIEREKENEQSDIARIRGEGPRSDEMSRIGGFTGGFRPDIAIQDRATRVAEQQLTAQKRIGELIAQQKGILDQVRLAIESLNETASGGTQ